jgi:hypothetical protein
MDDVEPPFEELPIYLELVAKLGDPFTVFERDYPDDPPEVQADYDPRDWGIVGRTEGGS